MKSFIKKSLQSLLIVPLLALGVSAVAPAFVTTDGSVSAGFNKGLSDGAEAAQGRDQPDRLDGSNGIFTTITNILLFIIGAVAVIMLIIGGIRYVTSGGDSTAVTAAKNTILYAVVGIVVAIIAYAVVNFVIENLAR